MTCDNCFHYVSSPVRNGYGHCRRKSPTADATGKALWPMVYQTDCCGEYSPMVLREPGSAKPDDDGWIDHDGGPRPVDDDVVVDLITRDGDVRRRWKAGYWYWRHNDLPEDIMRYRPAKGGEA